MEKLLYEAKATQMIRQVTSGLSQKFNVDMTYIEKYNESCPGCDKPFKNNNGVLSSIGAVVSFIPFDNPMKVAIPFCLCKSCYKSKASPINNVRNKVIDAVMSKLG